MTRSQEAPPASAGDRVRARFENQLYSPFARTFCRLLQESAACTHGSKSALSDCDELWRLRVDTRARIAAQLTLPTIPVIVEQLDAVLDSPNSRAADIADVVMMDAGLTVRVLALVNSPLCGMSRRIDSLEQAVSLLGIERIRSAVLTVSVIGSFSREAFGLDVSTHWEHSLAVATGAQLIGGVLKNRGTGSLDSNSLFLSGLLHDVGRLVVAQQLPDEFRAIRMAVNSQEAGFLEAELAILGMTHSEIGYDLLTNWGLAPEICDAALNHHHAESNSDSARVIHCADAIAHGLGYSPEGQPFPYTSPRVWETLELSNQSVRGIAVGLTENMAAISDALLH
ncbi:MAG: HDOD domain-containing protein [Planctomycetaceae bacterium]